MRLRIDIHSIGVFSVAFTRFFSHLHSLLFRVLFLVHLFFRRNEGRSTGVKWILCTLEILCMAEYLSCRAFWRLGESWISGGDRFSVLSFFIYICFSFFLAIRLRCLLFHWNRAWLKEMPSVPIKLPKDHHQKVSGNLFLSVERILLFFAITCNSPLNHMKKHTLITCKSLGNWRQKIKRR